MPHRGRRELQTPCVRMLVLSGQRHRCRMQARSKQRAAAVALGKMYSPHRPSKAWEQMWFFRSRLTNQEWTQRCAADELECKFKYCIKDCECAICSNHRTGKKSVVGCCYCSRCRSMCPKMNCSRGHGLACEEALRGKRPRHNE